MTDRFRIYCGLSVGGDNHKSIVKNSKTLALELAEKYFDSFTVEKAEGRWHGEKEKTLVITYLTELRTGVTLVNAFAHAYKYQNNQESVLIVADQVSARFY